MTCIPCTHVSHTGVVYIIIFMNDVKISLRKRDNFGSSCFFVLSMDFYLMHFMQSNYGNIQSKYIYFLIFCRRFSQWKFQPENPRSVCKSDCIFKGMCLNFSLFLFWKFRGCSEKWNFVTVICTPTGAELPPFTNSSPLFSCPGGFASVVFSITSSPKLLSLPPEQ